MPPPSRDVHNQPITTSSNAITPASATSGILLRAGAFRRFICGYRNGFIRRCSRRRCPMRTATRPPPQTSRQLRRRRSPRHQVALLPQPEEEHMRPVPAPLAALRTRRVRVRTSRFAQRLEPAPRLLLAEECKVPVPMPAPRLLENCRKEREMARAFVRARAAVPAPPGAPVCTTQSAQRSGQLLRQRVPPIPVPAEALRSPAVP